jgi:hypothetical protein
MAIFMARSLLIGVARTIMAGGPQGKSKNVTGSINGACMQAESNREHKGCHRKQATRALACGHRRGMQAARFCANQPA